MKNDNTLHESFEKELADISNNSVFNPDYRKKKLIMWIIRTCIMIILYVIFWKHDWVRKSLYFTIPLSLISLFVIFGTPFLLNKKIQRTRRKIEEADKVIRESEEGVRD